MQRRRDDVLRGLFRRVSEHGEADGCAAIFVDETATWEHGAREGLEAAHLIAETQPAQTLTCIGCDERCQRPAEIVDRYAVRQVMSTCHLYQGFGPFFHSIEHLKRWTITRQMVAGFVARGLGCRLPSPEGKAVRFPFGTLSFGRVRRAVSLEFRETACLLIGGCTIELWEIVDWQGAMPLLDTQSLQVFAREAPDLQSGGKRVLPSATVQQDRKRQTEIRDNKLQRTADRLCREHPKWNKQRIAQELANSPEFESMSPTRIERIIRISKN